jgi:hypothetical protein
MKSLANLTQNQAGISRVNTYFHLYSPYSQNPLRRCYFKYRASMKTQTLHREEIAEGQDLTALPQNATRQRDDQEDVHVC